MSFQCLNTISERYAWSYIEGIDDESDHQPPRTPITPQLPSDESDTDSVTSNFTEDIVTDNGEEHSTDRRARFLRRWEAKICVNNTLDAIDNKLRYVQDGIDNQIQNARRSLSAGRDYLHNDVAPFYEEATFQLQILATVSYLMIAYAISGILNLFVFCLRGCMKLLVLGLSYISTPIGWVWRVEYQLAVSLGRTSMTFIRTLCGYLGIFLRWCWRDGMKSAVTLGILSMALMSLSHGWLGMKVYVCNDAALAGRSPFICKVGRVNATLQAVNWELAALVDASDAIIHTTDDLVHPTEIDNQPSRDLVTEITAFREFANVHRLVDPSVKSQETHAAAITFSDDNPTVVAEMHTDARKVSKYTANVRLEYAVRHDELQFKLNNILGDTKKSKPGSFAARFISETLSYIIPAVFLTTDAHRQVSDYERMARQVLNNNLTTSLLSEPPLISQTIEKLSHSVEIVSNQLKGFQDVWSEICQKWDSTRKSDVARCHNSPETLISRLEAAFNKTEAAAVVMSKAHAQHDTILRGFVALHKQLQDLQHTARGWKGEPYARYLRSEELNPRFYNGQRTTIVDAISARMILQQFVTHVGQMDILLGKQRKSDEVQVPVAGFKWYIKDGKVVQHNVHWDFWNNVRHWGDLKENEISHN